MATPAPIFKNIRIEGDASKLVGFLTNPPKTIRTALYDFVLRAMGPLALQTAGHVVKTQLSGRLGPSFTGNVNKQVKKRRTGNLARSIDGRAIIHRGIPAIQVGILRQGLASQYASLQEHGTRRRNPSSPHTTIKPVNAKALAFPPKGSPALTPTGVPRVDGPRSYPEKLIPIYFRNRRPYQRVIGALYLEREVRLAREAAAITGTRPRLRSLRAVYLLITSVDIKPGFYLTDGVQDFLPTVAARLGEQIVDEFLKTGGR